ncbi:MAG TPA: hypothetical protein VM938_12715 [Acidimicrobiales bacterium]|nr:hypothetical protein [Acidimicrobiales bacterium]
MPSFTKLFNRFLFVLLGAAFGLTLSATAASAAPSGSGTGGNPNAACDGTHHSDSGHGANRRGAYDETCDGSPSGNGNGTGAAKGKPCAGCVGNADDKNPPGQKPNGSDRNAGYECDRNRGVGRTNPAHTGCRTTSSPTSTGGDVGGTRSITTVPPACPAGSTMVDGACVSGASTVKPTVATDSPVAASFIPDPSGPARVLGVQFLRPSLMSTNVGSELARSAGTLPITGNSSPDLVPMALALCALGTLLARFGRSQKREVKA